MTTKRAQDYMTLTGQGKKAGGRDWNAAIRRLQGGKTKSQKSAGARLEQWKALWEAMQSAGRMYQVSFSQEHDDFDRDENDDVVLSEAHIHRLLVCQCKRDRGRGHCSHKLVVADC